MPNFAIETYRLTKRFSAPQGWLGLIARSQPLRPAVDQVSISVVEGELFGLLGPNGAGKTTLIKLLCTLIRPSSGAARVGGHDLSQETAIKSIIGLVTSDERSFYWRLTGRQNLEFFAALHRIPSQAVAGRVENVLGQVSLLEAANQRFQTYSTGMRQRLAIARALLNQPRLLFMDEPTKGLDLASTRQLHHLIREQLTAENGITVFLTTHDMDEAQRLCDRVAVIHHGRIRGCGSLSELRRELRLPERYQIQVSGLAEEKKEGLARLAVGLEANEISPFALAQQAPAQPASAQPAYELTFPVEKDDSTLLQVIDEVRASGGHISQITRQVASLEDIFDTLTIDQPAPASPAGMETVQPVSTSFSETTRPALPVQMLRTNPLQVALSFVRRDLAEEASYRFSFFMQIFGMLFSVATFYFIAQMLGPVAGQYLSQYGGDYFAFVLIGIAFSGYFGVGLSSFASSLRHAQTTGTLEAMLTTPTGLSTIILCSSLWNYLLITLRVIVFLMIGTLFLGVKMGHSNYLAALVLLALTIVSFSSLGIISASFIMVLKRGDPVTWMVSSLSSLLGGVYFPISVLPSWLQSIANLLPVTYSLEGMRKALLLGASFSDVAGEIGALGVFSVVLLPLSLYAFRFAVQRARVDGSLTHY